MAKKTIVKPKEVPIRKVKVDDYNDLSFLFEDESRHTYKPYDLDRKNDYDRRYASMGKDSSQRVNIPLESMQTPMRGIPNNPQSNTILDTAYMNRGMQSPPSPVVQNEVLDSYDFNPLNRYRALVKSPNIQTVPGTKVFFDSNQITTKEDGTLEATSLRSKIKFPVVRNSDGSYENPHYEVDENSESYKSFVNSLRVARLREENDSILKGKAMIHKIGEEMKDANYMERIAKAEANTPFLEKIQNPTAYKNYMPGKTHYPLIRKGDIWVASDLKDRIKRGLLTKEEAIDILYKQNHLGKYESEYSRQRKILGNKITNGSMSVKQANMILKNIASSQNKDSYVTGGQIAGYANTLAPVLNIAGTAMGVPMLGTMVSTGANLYAGYENNKLAKQNVSYEKNPMLGANQYSFNEGGMIPLNDNALQVTGNPNQVDGNTVNYKGKDINLDYNETLDTQKDRVISDKYINPLTGNKIVEEDKKLKKAKGLLEKKGDVISKNTIGQISKMEDYLFLLQEQVATKMGDRQEQQPVGYALGGGIDPTLPTANYPYPKQQFDWQSAPLNTSTYPTGVDNYGGVQIDWDNENSNMNYNIEYPFLQKDSLSKRVNDFAYNRDMAESSARALRGERDLIDFNPNQLERTMPSFPFPSDDYGLLKPRLDNRYARDERNKPYWSLKAGYKPVPEALPSIARENVPNVEDLYKKYGKSIFPTANPTSESTTNGNLYPKGLTNGDYVNLLSGVIGNLPLAKAAFSKADKEPYRTIDTPLTMNLLDPTNALSRNQDNFGAAMYNTNERTSNQAMSNSLIQNLFANKMRADNDVIADYRNRNQGIKTNYEDRIANRQAMNNQSMLQTDQINAQNRAVKLQAQQALGMAAGNIGSTVGASMNQRLMENIALSAQAKKTPDVMNQLKDILSPELLAKLGYEVKPK